MFPIFRLNQVSRDGVLRNMNPIELFNLSLCSKNSLANVKNLHRKTNRSGIPFISIMEVCSVDIRSLKGNELLEWSFSVHETEGLGLQNRNQFQGVINGVPFTGVIDEDENNMKMYWQNEEIGFKALIEYFWDLYGKYMEIFYYSNDSGNLIRLLQWAHDRPYINYNEAD